MDSMTKLCGFSILKIVLQIHALILFAVSTYDITKPNSWKIDYLIWWIYENILFGPNATY